MDAAVIIREADIADAPAIAEVHVAAWQSGYRGLIPATFLDALSIADRTRRWRQHLATLDLKRRQVFVAEDGSGVRGFIALGQSRDADATDSTGELFALYVAPECWEHGFGDLLHRHALDSMRELHLHPATLWVLESNQRARTFYEHRGWMHDRRNKDIDDNGVTLHATRYWLHLLSTPRGT